MSKQEEAEVTGSTEGEVASAGVKSKLPMIAMVAVGLAIGGGTGAVFVGPMVATKMGKTITPPADSAAHEAEAGGGDHAPAEGGGTESALHVIENLVLNPANSGGSRFLLLSVAIESGTPAVAADMTTRDAELRDIILTSLGTKSVEQLTDMSTRDGIKAEVMTAVTARFGKNSVKRLYFPQFVVQ